MKQCRDGHCIAMFFFCDRDNDCGDWSDELSCTIPAGMVTRVINNDHTETIFFSFKFQFPRLAINCPTNTFHCEGQVCIPQNWVCDGMEDCSDGRDEINCNKTIVGVCLIFDNKFYCFNYFFY